MRSEYICFPVAVLFCCTVAFAGGNRWQSYLEDDWNQFRRNININTVLYSGAWLSGMYLLSSFDEDLNRSIKSLDSNDSRPYFKLVDQIGNAPYSIPVMAGITGMTLLGNDRKLQDAAFTAVEAACISAMIVGVGKIIFGRNRPSAQKGAFDFSPLSFKQLSFPSGHSSTAFAFLTPWVYYYPSPWTYAMMVIPVSTALARMIFDRHWATDVLTGSLIGFIVGYHLTRWHKERAEDQNYYGNMNKRADLVVSFSIPIRNWID